jgi:tRNA A-37 threonylcarbamoyl transferase component Bud32
VSQQTPSEQPRPDAPHGGGEAEAKTRPEPAERSSIGTDQTRLPVDLEAGKQEGDAPGTPKTQLPDAARDDAGSDTEDKPKPKPVARFCYACGKDLGEEKVFCHSCGKRQGGDPLVGRILEDRYEVISRLGEGAMGAVYEVRHLRLGKPFAMKVIHAELAQVDEFVERFEREALSCSRLAHPNCISVTDFGRASSGELFLVMEYVLGKPLNELIQEKPLPVGKALEVTRQVLVGLHHAHQQGIIHRDIKPDNVMQVEGEGGSWRVKILDFGIAKVPMGDQKGKQLTKAGVVFGTPEYMAPEQALVAGVDARADLYATGVMLWRMLTGKPLFEGDGPVEILSAKLSNTAPSLEQVAPGLFSERLQGFLARALEREPSSRFADASEMLDALREIENELGRGLAVTPRPTAVQALVSRASEVPRRATGVFTDWYSCAGDAAQPTWSGRLKGLVTTGQGRIVLGAAFALLCLLVLVPVLALVGDSGPPAPPRVEGSSGSGWLMGVKDAVQPARQPKEDELSPKIKERLTKVRLFMAKGHCREASLDLKNLAQEQPKLARVHYLLGAALTCRQLHKEAWTSYTRAVQLDPSFKKDARIIEDAQRLLKHRKAEVQARLAALNFLGTKVGKTALPILIEAATSNDSRHVREHAAALVKWHGAEAKIDRLVALSLDLSQLPTCKERAEVVEKLRDLGDPRAIPALRKARDASKRVSFFRRKRKNRCCRTEIIAAIKHLLTKKR